MALISKVLRKIGMRIRRKKFEAELREEMALHVDLLAAKLVADGASPGEAAREARIRFGSPQTLSDEGRAHWGFPRLENLLQDARFGLRLIRRSPGFTAMAVLTLALGIGANTSVFSLIHASLLKPLPYPHPEELANVWRTYGNSGVGSVSIPDLRDWQNQNSAFEGIAAYGNRRFSLQGASEPEAVETARVSSNFFQVMGIKPDLGRGFLPEEEIPGEEHVVVLGHDLWLSAFGGDASVVGRTIQLNGESYTVVGIAPGGFHYPRPLTNAWVPLAPTSAELLRDAHDFLAIGRLRPQITLEAGRTQLNAISARMSKQYTQDDGLGALLIPLKAALVGPVQGGLYIASAIVAFVFLIACANVSTFLLSRAATRQREVAVRIALGASRKRLLVQFLVEGILLAMIASLVAAIAARWSLTALLSVGRTYLANMPAANVLEPTVVVFTMALGLAAAVVTSLAGAWSATRITVGEKLKESGHNIAGSGKRQQRAQQVLVAFQLSCTFVLLIGTGTMIETLVKVSRIQPGFVTGHVLTMRLPIATKKYSREHPMSSLIEPALERIRALPGVESAGLITYLPMQSWGTTSNFNIVGHAPVSSAEMPWAEARAVSSDYHRAMGIHLLRGRWFADQDGESAPRVAIVNHTFANQYLPGQDPVGQQMFMSDGRQLLTIVGVMDDVRQSGRESPVHPEVDVPYAQSQWAFLTATMTLAVRTAGDPLEAANPVRRAIQSVDHTQPVFDVMTLDAIVEATESDRRFLLWLLAVLSGLALMLATAGLFGQLSYAVSDRTHEIGVRMALGASRADVMRLVAAQGAVVCAIGMVVGLAGSFGLIRLLRTLVFGISDARPAVFLTAAATLALSAFFACYLPARRATRVDPITALRYE